MEGVTVCVGDALQLGIVRVSDSDGVRCDSVAVVEARYLVADVEFRVVGMSVRDEHDVDAVRSDRQSARLTQHKVAYTLCGSCAVGVADS